MSIPPLVCNSPPPPEQCEDDKEPEDYDYQYNSQPDDEEDSVSYNYDNLSSNTIYKTQTESIHDLKLSEKPNVELGNISPCSRERETKTNSPAPLSDDSEINSEIQEDCILEDLNLELTTESLQINIDEKTIENPNLNEDDASVLNIQDSGGTEGDIDDSQTKSMSQESSENDDLNILDDLSADISFNENDDKKPEEVLPIDVKDEIEKVNEEIKATASQFVDSKLNSVEDDDFGDFDSFQFTNPDTETKPETVMNVDNPWESNIESECFGAFTANFDSSDPAAIEVTDKEIVEESETKIVTENVDNCNNGDDDDDGFCDFDDFRSSEKADTAGASTENVMSHSSVLDFPTSDNEVQIMENINRVLATIFTEEVPEPSEMSEGNIDKSLGEIWGHLVDTDVRQPYMVNWNNTLGQKSLLKALCIDSRNILFGTRWNYNMPKFAANLSASPLQPQKPVQSNPDNSEQPDKDTNTWVDPFTPHGQEYTYAEALLLDLEHLMATLDQMAHKHSTLKISDLLSHACSPENEAAPTDAKPSVLDGFTPEVPASGSKIYSSTLSVQPIRQISLPDTHIFTPTDSETPRSKTIHYDNTRTIGAGFDSEIVAQKLETTHITGPEKDDYWDFQHFKGTGADVANTEPQSAPDSTPDASKRSFGAQILQPIKMEPVVPTLNWPDPGEVKETFMDFSDFVSSTTGHDDARDTRGSETRAAPAPCDDAKVQNHEAAAEIDDDFETFQSAPPTNHSIGFESIPQNSSSRISDLKTLPTRLESKMSDVSVVNSKPAEIPASVDAVFKSEPSHTGFSSQILAPFPSQVTSLPVLQPSPANRGQPSSGQILQPLSLEGFSQINWPNPGADWHDLSRFNPIESVHSLKSEAGASGPGGASKAGTPVHGAAPRGEPDDDWGDFVSGAPEAAPPTRTATFGDDDEWSEFVSSASVKPPNGLNTISFNVHTNLNLQKSNQIKYPSKSNRMNLDIPTLNYITPKAAGRGAYAEKHFQNL